MTALLIRTRRYRDRTDPHSGKLDLGGEYGCLTKQVEKTLERAINSDPPGLWLLNKDGDPLMIEIDIPGLDDEGSGPRFRGSLSGVMTALKDFPPEDQADLQSYREQALALRELAEKILKLLDRMATCSRT